jgi:hypothetical protein
MMIRALPLTSSCVLSLSCIVKPKHSCMIIRTLPLTSSCVLSLSCIVQPKLTVTDWLIHLTNYSLGANYCRKTLPRLISILMQRKSYLFTYNTFIKILYMFRKLPCSSSGGLRRNCIYAASGIVTLQVTVLCTG